MIIRPPETTPASQGKVIALCLGAICKAELEGELNALLRKGASGLYTAKNVAGACAVLVAALQKSAVSLTRSGDYLVFAGDACPELFESGVELLVDSCLFSQASVAALPPRIKNDIVLHTHDVNQAVSELFLAFIGLDSHVGSEPKFGFLTEPLAALIDLLDTSQPRPSEPTGSALANAGAALGRAVTAADRQPREITSTGSSRVVR